MRRLLPAQRGKHPVVLLRRADGDAQRIAQLRRGALVAHHDAGRQQRAECALRHRRSAPAGSCPAMDTRAARRAVPPAPPAGASRSRPDQRDASSRSAASASGDSPANASSAQGVGTGYGAWQRAGRRSARHRRSRTPMRAAASACAFDRVRSTAMLRLARQQRRLRTADIRKFAVGFVHHHQRAPCRRVARRCDRRRAESRRRPDWRASTGTPASRSPAIAASAMASRSGSRPSAAVAQRHFDRPALLQARADRIHAEHRRRDHHRILARHCTARAPAGRWPRRCRARSAAARRRSRTAQPARRAARRGCGSG